MMSDATSIFIYPDWYKVEQDAGKTIKRLETMRELAFYLENPDKNIRRLAIVRIAELQLKDAVHFLKEVLEDSLETVENKELAGWTLKKISSYWDMDLFINSRYLNKYSGGEAYNTLWGIELRDSLPSLRLDFTDTLISSLPEVDIRQIRQYSELSFEATFSFAQWSKAVLSEWKLMVLRFPSAFFSWLISMLKSFWMHYLKNAPRTVYNYFSTAFVNYNARRRYKKKYNFHQSSSVYSKSGVLGTLKNLTFNIFYVLLFPIRIILHKKKVILMAAVIFAVLLAQTPAGKTEIYRRFGLDVEKYQSKIITISEDLLEYAWKELKLIKNRVQQYLIG